VGQSTAELRALAQREGVPAYRGAQIAEWLYRRGARTIEEMTSLPEELRVHLSATCEVGRSSVVTQQTSRDGTVKLLLALRDGEKIETVGLPYDDRVSCCVSTQVGCPIGCIFCATGQSGFTRNLDAGEIVDQVLTVQDVLRSTGTTIGTGGGRINHVTFMGMGEPLLNYEETLKALWLLNQEMGIAMRHLTVSTAGIVPAILRMAEERLQLTLAVSLHAPSDTLRQKLIPGSSKWTLAELMYACRNYILQTGRRVTFEYCLLDGINDGLEQAKQLNELLKGMNCHVNLIPGNPVPGLNVRRSSPERLKAFREMLEGAGIQVTQRVQRGSDIDAACGQLRRRNSASGTQD